MKAQLVLEDGTVFIGNSIGKIGSTMGEVVFNTSMTGYQEILTDPSYEGQIVALTYPLIGNYGHITSDGESTKSHVQGLIIKDYCKSPSNWRSEEPLEAFLLKHNVVGLSGIDTRALTQKLRQHGNMRGVITSIEQKVNVEQMNDHMHIDLVQEVTTKEPYIIGSGNKHKIALIDCGTKQNIVRSLTKRDCQVTVLPAHYTTHQILQTNPHGVVFSNGPGNPTDIPYVINTVKELLGSTSIFGICLGHQVIALALGAKTYKLKFGHRGANHPVKDISRNRVYITSQNHGYAVESMSLKNTNAEITHINLNDSSVEGLRHKYLPISSVQFHPEACPGPEDTHYLFDDFVASIVKK